MNDSEEALEKLSQCLTKPGHRKRFLFKLGEETCERKINMKKSPRKISKYQCWGCSSSNTGILIIPNLQKLLNELKLDSYLANFLEAGYDDYETLVMTMCTQYAIDEKILENEVRIGNSEHIKKILKKIEADHLNSCSRKSLTRISFEEPKNVACNTCNIY